MATTFVNLGFEAQGARVGEAANWTLDLLASVEEFAAYGPAVGADQPKGIEDFEAGWLDNEMFATTFAPTALEDAFYDTAPQRPEDFENEWLSNEQFSLELSAIDQAQYDSGTPEPVEDFEEEWLSNETFSTTLGAIDQADYGGVGGAEDFEQSWGVDDFKTVIPIHPNEFPTTTLSWFDSNPDTIVRSAGSWLAEGFVPGWGLQAFGTVLNDGLFLPIIGVTASTITLDPSDTALVEPGGPGVVQGVEDALYDGGALRDETFEFVWTPMTTPF